MWIGLMRSRRPTALEISGMYRQAAVPRQTSISTAVAWWTARSSLGNRSSLVCRRRVSVSGGVIGASVRLADPGVDVISAPFPEARDDLGDQLDAAQPLERLVAVHRGHEEPYRAAVIM